MWRYKAMGNFNINNPKKTMMAMHKAGKMARKREFQYKP